MGVEVTMRRLIPVAALIAMSMVACTAPSSQPPAGTSTPTPTSSSASAEPSPSPSSAPSSTAPGDGEQSPGEDEPGRFAYSCTSLDASPDVQLSSLAEVWAATNYTRMETCEVTFMGDEPFDPTPREAEAIEEASPEGIAADDGQSVILEVLRLCAKVSDETGPGGFAEASQGTLMAAASMCPESPQAGIIEGWADGTRIGDGSHAVGDSMEPGSYQLAKEGPSATECTWFVAGSGSEIIAEGGLGEAGAGVDLQAGQNFTSDKCGIWWKM